MSILTCAYDLVRAADKLPTIMCEKKKIIMRKNVSLHTSPYVIGGYKVYTGKDCCVSETISEKKIKILVKRHNTTHKQLIRMLRTDVLCR